MKNLFTYFLETNRLTFLFLGTFLVAHTGKVMWNSPWIEPCFYISIHCRRLWLLNICWIFYPTGIPHQSWGKFSNLWCSDYWASRLLGNYLLCTHSRQNSPPDSYHHFPGMFWLMILSWQPTEAHEKYISFLLFVLILFSKNSFTFLRWFLFIIGNDSYVQTS